MEERRKEWSHEVDRMRKDFFRLRPPELRKGSSDNLLDRMRLDDIFTDSNSSHTGDKKFRVSFDVSQFRPEEINVRTEEGKIMVKAKHEEVGGGGSSTREFSRQIDIPRHVDPQKLTCTLSKDGILQVEADVAEEQFDQIRAAAPAMPLNAPPVPSYEQARSASVSSNASSTFSDLHGRPSLQNMGEFSTNAAGPTMNKDHDSKSLKMEVDIGQDFLPEEIQVKTVDRKLLVSARHEEKSAGRTSVREFSREFDLPGDVDPNTVSIFISSDVTMLANG